MDEDNFEPGEKPPTQAPPPTVVQTVHQTNQQSVNQPPSNSAWVGLSHLQALRDSNLIDQLEFDRRKQQLVDQLTGTKLPSNNQSNKQSTLTNRSKRKGRRDDDYNQSIALSTPSPIHQSIGQTIDPPTQIALNNQTTNQSINQTINYSINPSDSMSYRIYQSTGVNVRPPPDFDQAINQSIKQENAIVHIFDMDSSTWSKSVVQIKMEATFFARGSLRYAYHCTGLQELEENERLKELEKREKKRAKQLNKLSNNQSNNQSINQTTDQPITQPLNPQVKKPINQSINQPKRTYVAKMSIDPFESRDSYFADVVMQHYARAYAKRYNSYEPPKKIEFLPVWLIELIDRPNKPLAACEVFIAGIYRKHNNNFGYVSEAERNTPQAFSHFTLTASNRSLCIVDIQGVGDVYTDPQIHSADGRGFGKGNMGQRGFDQFCQSHRCNAICKYLKLPPCNLSINQSIKQSNDQEGTMPSTTYMSFQAVDTVNINVTLRNQSTNQLINQLNNQALLPPMKKTSVKTPLIKQSNNQTNNQTSSDSSKGSRTFKCCVIL